mgnify:CR=1 FL=1
MKRHNAGIKMKFAQATPALLAQTIKSGIFKKVDYKPISTTGAQKAATFINHRLANDASVVETKFGIKP